MTTAEKAVELVREFSRATTVVTNAVNRGRGIISQVKAKREKKAARELFKELTGGDEPTDEQIDAMTWVE
jgi:hypothetical protein